MQALDTRKDEEMSLYELGLFQVDRSWKSLFQDSQAELTLIEKNLQSLAQDRAGVKLAPDTWTFTPRKGEVFRLFQVVPAPAVKVIIIAQDPYNHLVDGVPVACGIAFACRMGIQPSLSNIYKELQREELGFTPPNHGDLLGWCRQGVFLLNASLTCFPESKGTQKESWVMFTHRVLEKLTNSLPNLAICLWGKDAQSYEKYIKGTHLVLKASHPSPLSATKGDTPFIGCNHFSLVNQHLIRNGVQPIDWNL